MTLAILSAGFGRTGTLSLKAALETLGFAPCYHMATVVQNPQHAAVWSAPREASSLIGVRCSTVIPLQSTGR